MKKLILLIAFLLPVLLYGQYSLKYRVDAYGGLTIGGTYNTSQNDEIDSIKVVGDNVVVYVAGTAYYALPDTTYLLPSDTTSLSSRIDAIVLDVDTLQTDTINIEDVAIMLNDTVQLFVFGGGGGNAGDTAVFTTSTIYGSFFNESRDTLMVTSLRVVMLGDATDTLSVDILWDVNLNDGTPTELNANPLPVNSITSGDEDTSFGNQKIPPDVWVWCETPGVTAGKKPTYFNAQISGYIKRTE